MKKLKLSICILSLHNRHKTLDELLACLRAQPLDEVEILIATDGGQGISGEKRNRLMDAARGLYLCFIDDDDLVSPNYIQAIIKAIDSSGGVDAIAFRGRRTHHGGKPVDFDYRLGGKEGELVDGVLWRTPAHLSPIRTELARSIRFPQLVAGEDLAWSAEMKTKIVSIARAGEPGEVLYHYRWDPTKRPLRPEPHRHGIGHEAIFTPQYRHRSGPGSTKEASRPYRVFLEEFIRRYEIKSILDLGCGDLEVMSRVKLHGASYHGVDVIAERVRLNAKNHPRRDMTFERGDVSSMPLDRKVDLIVCKDVLQHWCSAEVSAFLGRLRVAPARFALITNCNYGPTTNLDIDTGGWRSVDLTKPPFELGSVVFRWDTKDVVLVALPTSAPSGAGV